MGRWEPGASGRLREAAMELYIERGFEQTTVAEIAERAGLTARTFFRYFADKREVLFGGAAMLQEKLVEALASAPESVGPLDAVATALQEAAALLGDGHAYSQQRYEVISANAELRERELVKMAALSAALADGLRKRGVADPGASLVAEAGVAVFRVAFETWVAGSGERPLSQVMTDSFAQLRAFTSAG